MRQTVFVECGSAGVKSGRYVGYPQGTPLANPEGRALFAQTRRRASAIGDEGETPRAGCRLGNDKANHIQGRSPRFEIEWAGVVSARLMNLFAADRT